ncbi:MAG: T9SS type A sorting domain-containing protein [Bacteroidetes bacterium]|nr:T9SS type A sorting domain-containing protein [Bacteroidota bacterium]
MKQLLHFIWLFLLSQQVFSQTITWTGATDTNWSTASNWSTNTAPTNANKVNIPGSLARYPVLNANVTIQNLVVEAGATLTVNASKELTINGSGNDVVLIVLGTVENNGTITINQITSTTANAMQLSGNGQFTNNAGATLSAATIGFYGIRVEGNSVLLNQVGGTIGAAGFSGSVFLSGSASPESVQNHGKMTLGGQIEKYAGTFHNYPCGVVKLSAGEVYNNGGQILNEGFFSAAANLNGTAANFINNGIIYIGGSSASYTNNAIRIFNNATTTSIFEFAASNNLTVEGIYKNDAATTSAGGYNQATNTFTHFGLAAGSQTLYAKITRPGGTCPQIVPFTFEVSSASTFTTQPSNQTACTGGSAEFMVAIANATSYQWQLNTGSGWNNVPAAAPYSNTTTATLNISNVAGLNGYQYRCFVTGPGGATLTSNAATLTISAGGASTPTGTITWTGSVDTDWNTACNWSPASVPTATNDVVIPNTTNKPTINTAAVAKSVEVRAGAILTIAATKSLTTNSAFDFGSGPGRISFLNLGTVQNNGRLVVDNSSLIIGKGVVNGGLFYNNSNAEISINKTTDSFLENAGGTFTNVSKITIDAASNGGGGRSFVNTQNGIFNNNEGGEMVIFAGAGTSFSNDVGSTVTNKAKITLIDNGGGGTTLSNNGSLTNTSLGEISITSLVAVGLSNNVSAVFDNAGKLTVGADGTSLSNQGIFNNNVGGDIKVERGGLAGINNLGIFTNSAKVTILATVTGDGLKNTGTLTNNACATLLVLARNYVNGVGGVTTNAGLIQIANSLENNGTFTNNGVLKYGSLTGTVTNATNSSLIVNNTPTPIFTYGGSYDGVINGIFTAMTALPGESAGAFTAPNTFVPSGLPSGSQTLYAKITPQGGACSFVVPFTYDGACSLVSTPTGLLTWTGAVSTDWNTACNWSPASVPTATNDVVIPNTANKPTINTAAVAKSVEVQAGAVLTIAATKSLTINGSRISGGTEAGFYNAGTVQNNGQLVLGNTGSVGAIGINNLATFNNNTGGEIKIDNSTQVGLYNLTGATFTNAAKLSIGASANVGIQGIVNDGTFNNNAGGELTIDRSTQIGIFNQHGTFTNAAKLTIGGSESTGEKGIDSYNIFNNNAGGDIKIDKAVKRSLNSSGSFTNAAKITIGATSGGNNGLIIGGTFDNTTGGEITIDRTTSDALFNSCSSFNNAGKITIGALASLGTTSGFGNVNTFNNNACGQVIVASGTVLNDASGSITNAGFVQIANSLENNGTFTNNGVLKYGSLTGTVTNATNSSLIVNNTPTPIFTYGGSYDGVINGIFTDANATALAGAFTAPNTFVASGLPAGSQTLYAKITPQGGACSFVVPFTFNNTALAPVFTTQPTAATRCAGSSVSFTAAATNATGYQWQLSTGGGWSNVPASAPYANTTTGTLAISDVSGLNGYQFRCVAIGATSNTNSDPASLTVVSKPTITLTALTQTLVEGNNPVLCDTDANPVNSLQFNVSGLCVSGSPVWRVQVGSGAWSAWSATAPVSQPSNNQPHRYQAACDAACPSTYTSPIELTINYRASAPQNVSLLVDGVTVAVGETKEVCSLVTIPLTFNANCAAGEIVLYSVDGGEYSSGVPTGLVDNQFHNYRVRCRKSDGTPSCVESESGVMRLKLVTIPTAPTVSLSSTSSCDATASFSGQSTCGSLRTVWYNASTNVALPSLPSTVPSQTTSYYARCQTENGCVSEKSNVVTFTLTPTQVAPVITASQEIVCTGTTVTVSANCPAGSQTFWNTGVTTPSFQVAFNNVTKQTYWAKCLFEGGCQSSESVRKDIYWNAFVVTLINVGETKSAVKSANDKSLWSSQFITRDGGPELEQSTQVNPTLYFVENANKTAPRYWTINVEACGLSTDGSLTFDMLATPEMGVIRSFNTHENNAPYFMYANREGWTELYAQNHPAYGFYQDNGAGGNVYDAGLPKGLYKLGIRYWDMKGWGSIYPSTRKPQGNVLAYQEYWFRIQSKDGVGVGAAREAATTLSSRRFADARDLPPNVFAQVMPNPVTNVLRLKVQNSKEQVVQTTLLDAAGRQVLSRTFIPETNTHQEEFGVSELPTGMYFLKVSTSEKQATLKVVKVD